MIPENNRILIDKLIIKTINKEALWSKTSANNEFKLDLDKGAIIVDSYGEDRNQAVDMVIINGNGEVIDKIYFTSRDEEEFKLLTELHTLARRAYYKVDETFKDILKELDDNKTVGNMSSPPDDGLPF